jgi:hypothetical protein
MGKAVPRCRPVKVSIAALDQWGHRVQAFSNPEMSLKTRLTGRD